LAQPEELSKIFEVVANEADFDTNLELAEMNAIMMNPTPTA